MPKGVQVALPSFLGKSAMEGKPDSTARELEAGDRTRTRQVAPQNAYGCTICRTPDPAFRQVRRRWNVKAFKDLGENPKDYWYGDGDKILAITDTDLIHSKAPPNRLANLMRH